MSEQSVKNPQELIEAGYRKGVGVVLCRKGKIFLAERADIKGAWQMPQGGVDEGEDLLATARRELEEETAVTREEVELMGLYSDWTVYDLPEKGQKKLGSKGQVQKWFFFEFLGGEKEIDLSKAKDKEFKQFRWATPEEVIEASVDFRKPVYEEIFKAFSGLLTRSSEKAK
jgi:8-oxo-dGTP pyrophosphatase MutT (NUDIX family)